MLIAPSKLTLSGGSVGAIYVVNRSPRPRDFRAIGVELGDGDDEYRNGGELLRFGPRQFSLAPEESQLLRITARRTNNQSNAPLRARIKISILPEVRPREEPIAEDKFSLSISGIYAVSVPIDIAP